MSTYYVDFTIFLLYAIKNILFITIRHYKISFLNINVIKYTILYKRHVYAKLKFIYILSPQYNINGKIEKI